MVVKSRFEQYMAELDETMQEKLGFGVDDLNVEFDYFSAYSEGLSVSEAAERAVLEAEGD